MQSEEPKTNQGHETTDADVKPILWFLVGLALMILVAMVGMTFLFNALQNHYQRAGVEMNPVIDVNQIPPNPRLQPDPAEELAEIRGWEDKTLHNYEWIDEETGAFRIPIERAMEIIVETGLPARSSRSEDQAH
jgi:hypothetical protein